MLQQDQPDDYVVATGETHSVKELVELAFAAADLDWEKYVVIDERFLRPAEVDLLVGDPAKAEKTLGWHRDVDFPEAGPDDGRGRPGPGEEPAGADGWPWPIWRRSTPTRSASWWPSAPGCSRSCRRASCRWSRPTCRWCRGSRRPSCRPSAATARGASRRVRAASPRGRSRSGRGPGTGAGAARRRPGRPARRPPATDRCPTRRSCGAARPAAAGDPGLHRRVHRGLHHPRRLRLVARPALPHPPAARSRWSRAS